MALKDYFADYADVSGRVDARNAQGVPANHFEKTISIAAADDINSTYFVTRLPYGANISALEIEHDAIAGTTDVDIGLYNPRTGAVVDIDCLADGLDLTSAATKVAPKDGLLAVTHENTLKALYELAGHTLATRLVYGYDVVLTAKSDPSGTGKVTLRGRLNSAG